MKISLTIILCFLTLPALGEVMPIRGATGGGYGRFSWGTSLETVETLVKTLSPNRDSRAVQSEHNAIKAIRADRRRNRADRTSVKQLSLKKQLTSFRYWIKLGTLSTRVDLSFSKQRLYQAIVGATYNRKQQDAISDILDIIVEKYGMPEAPVEGEVNMELDNEFNFKMAGGALLVQRTPPTKSKSGYLRLDYRSTELYPGVESYLNALQKRALEAKKSARKHRKKTPQKTPRERQIDRMKKHL